MKRTILVLQLILLATFYCYPQSGCISGNCENGQGTFTTAYGTYVGEFKDGKYNGKGTFVFLVGDKYEGEYKDGKYHGHGTYTWKSGEKYEGEYKNREYDGYGIYYYPNGDKYEGEFKVGYKDGQGTMFYKNGEKKEGLWKKGEFIERGTKEKRDSLKNIKIAQEEKGKIITKYFQGIAELSYNNFDAAINKFNDAINAKPDFAEALKRRKVCFHKMKQPDKALVDSIALNKIIASSNKEDMLFVEEYKKLEREINKNTSDFHLECYYRDDKGWYMKGKNVSSNADKIKYFSNAIKFNDTNAEYFIARGDAFTKSEKYNAANEDYKKAIQLNPKCEWYDYKFEKTENCPKCKGDGYTIEVSFSTQEVNNKKNVSGGGSKHIPCTECKNGKVTNSYTIKAVRIAK